MISKQMQGKILTIGRFFIKRSRGKIKKVVLRGNLFYLYGTGDNYVNISILMYCLFCVVASKIS